MVGSIKTMNPIMVHDYRPQVKELHPEGPNKLKVYATSQNFAFIFKNLSYTSFFSAKDFNFIRRRKR